MVQKDCDESGRPDRRRVNRSDVFHISYSNNGVPTGTLNPAETVKLIGEPYEESSDFSNTVESYMLQVLEQFQLKTLFESDGAYNPDKVIDVMSYFGASGADAENHSGLVYRLSDLIEWSKAYSV